MTENSVKPKTSGFTAGLLEFLNALKDMETKNHETMKNGSGKIEGPFGGKAEYGYTVKIGIEQDDFPIKRVFHSRRKF